MSVLQILDRRFEEVLCGLAITLMACSVMLQVILRFVFATASPWAEELAVYGMIFAVYFGATMATRERQHIRIGILIEHSPRPLAVAMVVLADLLWAGFVVLMVLLSIEYMELLFRVTQISPGLGLEQRWIRPVVPFAFALMLFRILQVYWRWGQTGWKGLPL